MMMRIATLAVVLAAVTVLTQARPQGAVSRGKYEEPHVPMPYDFDWKVRDEQYKNFYGHNEVGDAAGRVDGSYHVWLPDGRLMTVSYYVDGESGFVPKITYEQVGNPFTGAAGKR
ncbi:uncharacterized protein [Periplaneta americana]|uniref:uncharacterized protein n=1 Tax=Periplaneta americana TaxID=6978 RepID=UPI0037E9B771